MLPMQCKGVCVKWQTTNTFAGQFLNAAPADLVQTSYALVHVEDSERGTNPHGSNSVNIADCKRVITLDFYLGNQQARDSSIAKINLLLEILGEFRDVSNCES